MKITLTSDKLSKALTYVARAVTTKPNIPVLSNILLEVHGSDLKLSATNLDMGIHMWIAGQGHSDGKVTASGKFLTDFINATQGGKVDISLEGDNLTVQTANSHANFQTIAAVEFPVLPQVSGTPLFTIQTQDLVSALDQVLFAASADLATSRVQFTGILFTLGSESATELTMVGLDGYRLSKKIIPIDQSDKSEHQLIVPARSLQELMKILKSEQVSAVEVYLSESKSQLIFQFAEIEFSVRLLEGPYPEYEKVIPTKHSFSFDVAKSEFEQALKIVNTFARNVYGYKVEWDMDLETETLTMRSSVPELGVNETKVSLKNAQGSNDLRTAFNLTYLLDVTNHLTGDLMHFETNSPLEPAVFTTKMDKNFIHLVIPMQRG